MRDLLEIFENKLESRRDFRWIRIVKMMGYLWDLRVVGENEIFGVRKLKC